jgi:salicylate hydroxylase
VPTSRLAAAGETAEVVKQPGAMIEWAGDDRRLLGYPCANNSVFNLGAFLPASEIMSGEADEGGGGHGRPSRKDDLVRAFAGFSPEVRGLIAEADEAKLMSWALTRLDRLPAWARGRVALLGDAAHAFEPWLGQGAAMAVEDAVSVAIMLPLGTAPEQVPSRLALYERARMERVSTIQEFTRLSGQYVGRQNRLTPAQVVKAHAATCGHNERECSARVLEEALKGGSPGLGDGVEAVVDTIPSKPGGIQLSAW